MSSYISLAELAQFGISAKALATISPADQQAAITAASEVADTYLQKVVGIPLAAPVPTAVKMHIAWLAVYVLFNVRGINRDGDDKILEDNYDRALKFFEKVSAGTILLGPTVTEPIDNPADDGDGPFVYSDTGRGYRDDGYI